VRSSTLDELAQLHRAAEEQFLLADRRRRRARGRRPAVDAERHRLGVQHVDVKPLVPVEVDRSRLRTAVWKTEEQRRRTTSFPGLDRSPKTQSAETGWTTDLNGEKEDSRTSLIAPVCTAVRARFSPSTPTTQYESSLGATERHLP